MAGTTFALVAMTLLGSCSGDKDDTDEARCPLVYPDEDGDGFGVAGSVAEERCDPGTGWATNALDCDDADADVNPDATEVCEPAGVDDDCNGWIDDDDPGLVPHDLWPDVDGDGFGDGEADPVRGCAPTAGVADDSDCDDDDPDAFPGAAEVPFDGVDQDCSGADQWFVEDGFEGAGPDPVTFPSPGPTRVSDANKGGRAASGRYALVLRNQQVIETLDIGSCDNPTWSFAVGRSADSSAGELRFELELEGQWTTVDFWNGTRVPHEGFVSSRRSDGRRPTGARFMAVDLAPDDTILLDDFRLACTGPDGDGDGIGDLEDCAVTDAAHWFDCGLCEDADGDDYGVRCDLGEDCHDGQPLAAPGNTEIVGDGIDQDCDGFDDPSIFVFDDFDDGEIDPALFQPVNHERPPEVVSGISASGDYSVQIGTFYDGYSLALAPLDTSTCDNILWHLQVKRGPPAPPDHRTLGVGDQDVLEGGATDQDFLWIGGQHRHPRYFAPNTVLGVATDFPHSIQGGFHLDDVTFGCGALDEDDDGTVDLLDCADSDPDHWLDCEVCVDLDGDGFGEDCDRGADCDDSDATVGPLMPDVLGDGIDADCNGWDGPGILDDFETGRTNPTYWAEQHYTYNEDAAAGTYSAAVQGIWPAETVTFDTSACTDGMEWSFDVRIIGYLSPWHRAFLQWWDGTDWRTATRMFGGGTTAPTFVSHSGFIADASAAHEGFRLRFDSLLDRPPSSRGYRIDNLLVRCASDRDVDGVSDVRDCAPDDAAHWADCGVCVDGDGDGFGAGCDLGLDCDDVDQDVYLGAPDVPGDGLDESCSGFDGPGLRDGFEAGNFDDALWLHVDGMASTTDDVRYVGTGSWSADLEGFGEIVSRPFDTTTCSDVDVSFAYRRRGVPKGVDLEVSIWNGTAWLLADRILGDGVSDDDFVQCDVALAADALHDALQIRLRQTGDQPHDHYYIDDLDVGCGAL